MIRETKFTLSPHLHENFDELLLLYGNHEDHTAATLEAVDTRSKFKIIVELFASEEDNCIIEDGEKYTNPKKYTPRIISLIKNGMIWEMGDIDPVYVDFSKSMYLGYTLYDDKNNKLEADNDPFETSLSGLAGVTPEIIHAALKGYATDILDYLVPKYRSKI